MNPVNCYPKYTSRAAERGAGARYLRFAYNGRMGNQAKTVAIVGGGASGLVAAIAVSERARELGYPVYVNVYEKDDRVETGAATSRTRDCSCASTATPTS